MHLQQYLWRYYLQKATPMLSEVFTLMFSKADIRNRTRACFETAPAINHIPYETASCHITALQPARPSLTAQPSGSDNSFTWNQCSTGSLIKTSGLHLWKRGYFPSSDGGSSPLLPTGLSVFLQKASGTAFPFCSICLGTSVNFVTLMGVFPISSTRQLCHHSLTTFCPARAHKASRSLGWVSPRATATPVFHLNLVVSFREAERGTRTQAAVFLAFSSPFTFMGLAEQDDTQGLWAHIPASQSISPRMLSQSALNLTSETRSFPTFFSRWNFPLFHYGLHSTWAIRHTQFKGTS